MSDTKKYCELPDTLSQEFGDYLKLVLSSRLGLTLPDRIEEYANNDIKDLCKVAWDNFGDQPEYTYLEKVRKALPFKSLF